MWELSSRVVTSDFDEPVRGEIHNFALPRNLLLLREIGLAIAAATGPQIMSALRFKEGEREFVRFRRIFAVAFVLQNLRLRNRVWARSDAHFPLKASGTSPAQELLCSKTAMMALCVFLVLAMPENIYAAIKRIAFGGHVSGPKDLLLRLPLQLILSSWVYWFAVRQS